MLAAYGWSDLAPALIGRPGGTTPRKDQPPAQAAAEEQLLSRLLGLNAERAAAEARGELQWLRPGFQDPGGHGAGGERRDAATTAAAAPAVGDAGKPPWPKTLTDQVLALRQVLAAEPAPATAEQLARRFRRVQTPRVAELLDTLVALGQARSPEPGTYSSGAGA